ncbi:MAG: transposase family protein [Brevundimonas sp.]
MGRPTLTLIIDAYTRMCVGCYASLGAPSIVQTAMALLRAFMPKEALLEAAGVAWDWPSHGFPEIVHSDNGSDFRSLAIRRGLNTYDVEPHCRRHGSPLVDVETFDLVPVVIDGQRERRVRLLRNFEKTVDRFLRRARGGGFNRQIIPAAALCLEADIDAALDGRRLPALWCLGADWPRARRSLIGLADLLLSPSRTGHGRLIHYVADEGPMPQSHTQFFTTGGFPVLGSLWQRRILESCARLLIDPDRYEHLDQGRRYTPHADLLGGGGTVRAHGALGRMASADTLSTILAYARVEQIERLEANLPGMAKPLANRIRNAAAVALYIP